jgi:hypothetical protein
MSRIEFLLADEDHTWRTKVFDVPDDTPDLLQWAHEHLAVQAQYRRVVLWAVYSLEPDDNE